MTAGADHTAPVTPGSTGTEISNALVALLRQHLGRGPERSRAIVSEDLVVWSAWGGLSAAERTLVEAGRADLVRSQRADFDLVMRERYEEVVARATGRRVIAFMGGTQGDTDMTILVFALERGAPQAAGGSPTPSSSSSESA